MKITGTFDSQGLNNKGEIKVTFKAHKLSAEDWNEMNGWRDGGRLTIIAFSEQACLDFDEEPERADQPGDVQLTAMAMLQPRDVYRFAGNELEYLVKLISPAETPKDDCEAVVIYWDSEECREREETIVLSGDVMVEILTDAPLSHRVMVGDVLEHKDGCEPEGYNPIVAHITGIKRNKAGIITELEYDIPDSDETIATLHVSWFDTDYQLVAAPKDMVAA